MDVPDSTPRVDENDHDAHHEGHSIGTPYTVEREAVINASASEIRPFLVDFHKWVDWSPWEKLDPNMEHTYNGPDEGVGAHTAWTGNRKAGEGSMEITSTDETEVVIDLRFEKPFKDQSKITIRLEEHGETTMVRWFMDGEMNTMMRIIDKFKPMDDMLGKDFAEGLANLKRVSEA